MFSLCKCGINFQILLLEIVVLPASGAKRTICEISSRFLCPFTGFIVPIPNFNQYVINLFLVLLAKEKGCETGLDAVCGVTGSGDEQFLLISLIHWSSLNPPMLFPVCKILRPIPHIWTVEIANMFTVCPVYTKSKSSTRYLKASYYKMLIILFKAGKYRIATNISLYCKPSHRKDGLLRKSSKPALDRRMGKLF